MIEKNSYYWNLHKKFYKEALNELDYSVFQAISNNPHCDEARNLNKRVEIMVERELNKPILELKEDQHHN